MPCTALAGARRGLQCHMVSLRFSRLLPRCWLFIPFQSAAADGRRKPPIKCTAALSKTSPSVSHRQVLGELAPSCSTTGVLKGRKVSCALQRRKQEGPALCSGQACFPWLASSDLLLGFDPGIKGDENSPLSPRTSQLDKVIPLSGSWVSALQGAAADPCPGLWHPD